MRGAVKVWADTDVAASPVEPGEVLITGTVQIDFTF
jgi:hypothetical protein